MVRESDLIKRTTETFDPRLRRGPTGFRPYTAMLGIRPAGLNEDLYGEVVMHRHIRGGMVFDVSCLKRKICNIHIHG